MLIRKAVYCSLFVACNCAVLAATPSLADTAAAILEAVDKDSDQTLDLSEVTASAAARFAKLDTDSDGTLSQDEVKGVIGQKLFMAADRDNE